MCTQKEARRNGILKEPRTDSSSAFLPSESSACLPRRQFSTAYKKMKDLIGKIALDTGRGLKYHKEMIVTGRRAYEVCIEAISNPERQTVTFARNVITSLVCCDTTFCVGLAHPPSQQDIHTQWNEALTLRNAGILSREESWLPHCICRFTDHITDSPDMDWAALQRMLGEQKAHSLLSYPLSAAEIGYKWWTDSEAASCLMSSSDPYNYPPGFRRPPGSSSIKKRKRPSTNDVRTAKRGRTASVPSPPPGPTIPLKELNKPKSPTFLAWKESLEKKRSKFPVTVKRPRPEIRYTIVVSPTLAPRVSLFTLFIRSPAILARIVRRRARRANLGLPPF